jgi:hypothetical protein
LESEDSDSSSKSADWGAAGALDESSDDGEVDEVEKTP